MNLPKWYLECAEDYLSILRSSHEYSREELFQATKNQRLAEYKLMKERINGYEKIISPYSLPSTIPLQRYDNSMMYKGHFQTNRMKPSNNTRGFWENVLK